MGIKVGYNPKKKGQKSYHNMMAFVGETKEVLHSWFRCGSAYTSNGVVEFMKECMAYMKKRVRVLFRGDSGFFTGELLEYLETVSAGYLIKEAEESCWIARRSEMGVGERESRVGASQFLASMR